MRCTSGLGCKTFATKNILPLRDRLKVIWANTEAVTAEMVKLLIWRNWTDREHIGNAMNELLSKKNEKSVSIGAFSAGPMPAIVSLVHQRPKHLLCVAANVVK